MSEKSPFKLKRSNLKLMNFKYLDSYIYLLQAGICEYNEYIKKSKV